MVVQAVAALNGVLVGSRIFIGTQYVASDSASSRTVLRPRIVAIQSSREHKHTTVANGYRRALISEAGGI